MKGILKKGILLCLVASLCMTTGCGKQETKAVTEVKKEAKKEVAKGGYVEQDIEFLFDDGMSQYIFQRENGGIACYAAQDNTFYQLNDLGKWEKDSSLVSIQYVEDNRLNRILSVIEANGKIMLLCSTIDGEVVVGEVQEGGRLTTFILKENNKPLMENNNESYKFEVLPHGDVLLRVGVFAQVIRYDGKTGELKYVYDGEGYDFIVLEDKLYILAEKNMIGYDLESGVVVDTIDNVDGWCGRLNKGKEVGEWYLINKKGLFHLAPNGSLWEQILTADGTAFGSSELHPVELFIDNDSYVVFFASQDIALKKYYYDENVEVTTKDKITIYMLNENLLINGIAYKYQEEHKDVSIDIQVASSSGMSYEDILKALNTELLAGEGPDLIVLEYFPIRTYIDKGALLDISDLVKESLNNDEWYKNIVDAFKVDGKYYAVPTRFTVPMLWGKEEIVNKVSTIEDLAKYKKNHPNELILNKTKPELFAQFALSCIPSCINKDGSLNSKKVRSFLESIDKLAEQEYDKNRENEYSLGTQLETYKTKELLDMAYKVTDLTVVAPRSPVEAVTLTSALKQRGEGSVGVLKPGGKISFEARGILGINANSKNQEIAKEIVKIALGEQSQSLVNPFGNPIHKKAMANQKEEAMSSNGLEVKDDEGRRINIEIGEDENYKKVEKYWKNASLCVELYQNSLFDAIYEKGRAYCRGELTMDEALAQIEKVAEFQ